MSDIDLPSARLLCDAATPVGRMDAYYYAFDATGCGVIDAILSAVAVAGKGAHHTEAWGEHGYDAAIQKAADAAANSIRAIVPALIAEAERLTKERDDATAAHDELHEYMRKERQFVSLKKIAEATLAERDTLKRLLAEALKMADEGWTALADDKWHEKHDRIAWIHKEAGLPNE